MSPWAVIILLLLLVVLGILTGHVSL